MTHPTKIATCCYCGTRAALVLRGNDRHELSCSACGAPLHDLKMLPKARAQKPVRAEGGKPAKPAKKKQKATKSRPVRGRRLRRGLMVKLIEEAFDVIEDIFD
ncbi:MAG: hypothetical protein AB8B51_02870 [Sedimentitalea sp.]